MHEACRYLTEQYHVAHMYEVSVYMHSWNATSVSKYDMTITFVYDWDMLIIICILGRTIIII